MTERTVTIRLGIQDEIGNRLLELRKQRDALLSKSTINLQVNAEGIERARRASAQARAESAGAIRDLSALVEAISSRAVKPLADYQELLVAAMQATRALGSGAATALRGISVEFQRQKTLAQFWGSSGYLVLGVAALKSSLASFLATSGRGFTTWLQSAASNLTQYRTALVTASAVMIGMASAAALSSKHSQNYIRSTMDSRLMERKLTDRAAAERWVQSAEGTDWSAGRDSRMGTFQTVLSKNLYMGQKQAQKATEDLEKFFFANQEMLKKKGIQSAEDLASRVSAPTLSAEDATIFEDIFGLGFHTMTPQARLGRISTEAQGINTDEAVFMRPDVILTKRLTATTRAMGDAALPALNSVLGAFLKLSDVIGKIPGLGKALGWATVLFGVAAAGMALFSVVGSLLGGMATFVGLLSKLGIVTKLAAAAQWVLNIAVTANPIGIAIMAIAGLVAGLYLLEKKFGIVTKAWNALKGAFKLPNLKWPEFKLPGFGKLFSSAKDIILKPRFGPGTMTASMSPLPILISVLDFLKKVWFSGNTLNKLISVGLALWQRIVDFFSWLIESIKNGVQYLKDGLGITKSEAKEKYMKASEMSGGIEYFDEEGKKGWFDKQGNAVPGDKVPGYLKRAHDEYVNAPEGILGEIWNWLKNIFERLIAAITGLPGRLAESVKNWLPGLGGSEAGRRSRAEMEAGAAVESKAPGSYVLGPNDQRYTPEQWAMQYLNDESFGGNPVYDETGKTNKTVRDLMSREEALNAIIKQTIAGGKPTELPNVHFSEDSWIDLLETWKGTRPLAAEAWDRLESGTEGAVVSRDWLGNPYIQPLPPERPQEPERFKNQGNYYTVYNIDKFEVWNASGLVQGGFKTEEEAKQWIAQGGLPAGAAASGASLDPNRKYVSAFSSSIVRTGEQVNVDIAKGYTSAENWKPMARGGRIEATGALIGHVGEEVDPARVVAGGKTTLARITELISSSRSAVGGPSITIQAPPVNINIGRLEKDVDVDRLFDRASDEFDRKLLFKLRNSLNTMGMRDIGYLRG